MKSAQYYIEHLDLLPHPEGGWYRETYRADASLADGRSVATGIYFLLTSENISHLHKIDADEMWHFYTGDALTVHMIDAVGAYSTLAIGPDPEKGQVFQAVVPAGVWFGSTVEKRGGFSLVGCTVSPGFEFSGFEMADRHDMQMRFPQHTALIKRLTRD